jgi:hypothetical protein
LKSSRLIDAFTGSRVGHLRGLSKLQSPGKDLPIVKSGSARPSKPAESDTQN